MISVPIRNLDAASMVAQPEVAAALRTALASPVHAIEARTQFFLGTAD